MKNLKVLLFLLSVLILSSCAASDAQGDDHSADEPPVEQQEEVVHEAPIYAFESFVRSDSYVREDTGEEAAAYSYSLPVMSVVNENNLSDADREVVLRNVNAFNQRMNELMEELVVNGKNLLEEQKFLVETESVSFVACDEVVSSTVATGQVVSVVLQCYYYGGGAHPNSYTVTHTFDLSVGQFIDPTQIGDDPESFRVGAAELLIQHAESLGEEYTSAFWTDYQDVISRWNETAVFFTAEGMTVIFSVYELGPYAIGPVELTISYSELTNALGEGGLAHLGVK